MRKTPSLHVLSARGETEELRERLSDGFERARINDADRLGRTPLMCASQSERADVSTVYLLLDSGANVHQMSAGIDGSHSVLCLAVAAGDPEKVSVLLDHGANLHYIREHGYNALIDALHGRDIRSDTRLLALLRLLISRGVELNAVTDYNESGLRVVSRVGRFDAVRLLLDAGADESQLQWTPLIRAAAIETIDDVAREIETAGSLEERDYWERTAWLVSVQSGDLQKALLLKKRGADQNARGRCGKTALLYAIENHQSAMLHWLIENGAAIEETDNFGSTPLMCAAEYENAEAVQILLAAGANVDQSKHHEQTALSFASSRDVAMKLLNAGADPARLPYEARRAAVGLPASPDEDELTVDENEFKAGRTRRFGASNPEEINDPFWHCMIRAGVSAFQAKRRYRADDEEDRSAVWCAQRFGQSITFLPNGDIVQVAGEHEDSYDEDFCIFNDVFLHNADGEIRIFAYPVSVFPPTDFHTATLVDGYIYLIGSLDAGHRHYGTTPVYRLDTKSFAIESVETKGSCPGWIYKHRAVLLNHDEIRITGGTVVTSHENDEIHAANTQTFIFDTSLSFWRVA